MCAARRGGYDCGASQLLTIIRSLLAMATCPDCDAEIDVDEFDVDRGDELSCPECGSNLQVVAVSPVELEPASDDNDDKDDNDDNDDSAGDKNRGEAEEGDRDDGEAESEE